MRKALVVGINYYEHITPLHGCVRDAESVARLLEKHGNVDMKVNFATQVLTATGPKDAIPQNFLRQRIHETFQGDCDVALFYFAGHGHVEAAGGYLVASDSATGNDGISLGEVMSIVNSSRIKNKVIILDSCHSGFAGGHAFAPHVAELKEGTTILTASTSEQYASEENGRGVFTTLLTDALEGAAANLVGDITLGGIYAHIDQSLGPWQQRPVFKTNVKEFTSIRKVEPVLPVKDLRRITEFFPREGYYYFLDPSYEPERSPSDTEIPPPNQANVLIFTILQQYNRLNLLVPVDAPHMWHAAMCSKGCRLTALGEHYRRLVATKRI